MDVRRLTEAEVPEASELLRRCYAWLSGREGFTPEQTTFLQTERGSEETVRRESGTETYLVAHDGVRILGLVAVADNRITKLYVDPAGHGAGVGRVLYEAAEAAIRAAGHGKVALGAFPSAVPFYEAMGLRVVGHRESGGSLAGLTFTLMEKQLT